MLVSVPPTIPRSCKSEPGELAEHLTLWVRTGTAHLRVDDGREYRIDAGSGICVPPGTEHDVWTEPGTLVIPAWSSVPAVAAGPEKIAVFPIAAQDRDRLLERYSRWAWDDSPAFAGAEPLSPDLGIEAGSGGVSGRAPIRPLPPALGPARRVATELVRRPASDRSLDEWAAWAACSPSTLRRGFLAQTGSTFAHWRQLTRLAAAAELLAAGWPVGRVCAEVGFTSRWGFADAFRARYGVPPREFGPRAAETGQPAGPRPLDAAIGLEAEDRLLPDNVMLWVRAGELRARYAERLWVGRAGDVVWLPAGSTVERAPDASVPLSTLCTGCVQLDRPGRARFSAAWRDWLLWASVSTNSLLKSEEHRGRAPGLERAFHTHVIDAFTAQHAIERARSVPMPEGGRARAAAVAFLHALGTTSESATHELPAELRQAFRQETGMTFANWRHAARMRAARRLLQSGHPSTVVGTRVGYTMVSNFSRAFSRFHGLGPREFQQLEGPDEVLAAG